VIGEKSAREALARLAPRLRRAHHDAEERLRRKNAAEEAARNPRRGVDGRLRDKTSNR